jgi:hypothetical protein
MFDGAFSQTPFRFLFAGRAVSAVGDRLMPVALAFAVLDLTDSPGDLGLGDVPRGGRAQLPGGRG